MKKSLITVLSFLFIVVFTPLLLNGQVNLDVEGHAIAHSYKSLFTPQIAGQGGYIGWNRSGLGRMSFSNQKGLGDGGFEFLTYDVDNNLDNIAMTILGNGNAGIGTTTPQTELHIRGDGGLLRLDAATHPFMEFFFDAAEVRAGWFGYGTQGAAQHMSIWNHLQGYLRFATGDEEHMRINTFGNVGIGTIEPEAKLHIYTPTNFYAQIIRNENSSGSATGLLSTAIGAGTGSRTGIRGEASVSTGTKYGVYGIANLAGNSGHYGVYGEAPMGNSRWALYGEGNIYYTGSFTSTSDTRLKKNIKNLDSTLEKVMQLRPKTYEFKTQQYDYINLAQGEQVGFISQDIEKIFPNLVEEADHTFQIHDDKGRPIDGEEKKVNIKSLSYISFIPILTKAIQEQQAIIEAKEERITAVEQENQQLNDRLDQLEKMVQQILSEKEKETKTEQVGYIESQAYLQQNQPNPFHKNTKIHYFVPEQAQQAQLQITTTDGKLLRTFALQKGENAFTLDAKQLAAGTYIYTLVIDGRVMESKQMVLTAY